MKKSNIITFFSYLILIISLNQALLFRLPINQPIYYGLILISLLVLVTSSASFKINWLLLWFIIGAILSIVINNPPEVFQSDYRLISFLIIALLIGPILSSPLLNDFRSKLFILTNKSLQILITLSFLIYILRIPLPNAKFGFSGVFNHSMMLGPLAAVALILNLFAIKGINKKISFKSVFYYYLPLLSSFSCLIIASSRSAILAALGGILFYFFKLNNFSIGRFLVTIAFLSILLTISFPLWSDFTEKIQEKNEYSSEQGDFAASRRSRWEARKTEFNNNPVFGVGFAVIEEIEEDESQVDFSTGTIEPGSSWLAILSMIGLFGSIPIFILFIRYFLKIYQDSINPVNSSAIGAILIIFIVHMFAEGYFLASGSYLFFYVWLLLGNNELYIKYKTISIV